MTDPRNELIPTEAANPPPLRGAPLADPHHGRHARDTRFAALYAELHRIARREARRHGGAAQLGATTLLHETWLSLVQRDSLDTHDDARFLGYIARCMRGLVIDRLRAQNTHKRGQGISLVTLDTLTAEQLGDVPALDGLSEALDELAVLEPDLATVVDLRFFCGFTMAEIARQRGVTERTIQRQWNKARALLYRTLQAD
jgi:RNA polymerase sigma factor (TIGR02999 family)